MKIQRLSEIACIIGGGTPKTSVVDYWGGTIPWLSVGDFAGDQKKVYSTEKTITLRGLQESSTKLLKKGELIISARGTVGEIAMLGRDMAFNQSCYGLKAIECFISNDFLYYLLKYNIAKLKAATHGSVFDTITRQTFEKIEVAIPDLKTQTRIASILSSLDDKIELNRQMNQTLEQIAQALFNHYFAAKIDPDNLPEGWRYEKVGNYIDTVSKTHKFQKAEVIFLNTSDISEGKVLHSTYSNFEGLPGQAKKSIQKNDILFSEIRPANKRYAFINFEADDFVVSTKLMVLRAKKDIESLFFYFLLTRGETLTYLQNIAESRSGTFPQITFDQVKAIEFLLPDNHFLQSFIEDRLKPTYDLIFNNEKEIKTLATIRDTLLPKLMSGEIDIDELMIKELIAEKGPSIFQDKLATEVV